MARIALHITGDDKADAVLSRDPLALLIGMVLDQQVTIEKAFSSPADLLQRLGRGAARRRHHRRHGPRRAGRHLPGAAGAAPLPRLHGRPGPGRLPCRRRRVRRTRPTTSGRASRAATSCSVAAARPAGLRRAEGEDLRRAARQAAGRRARRGGARSPPPTARRAARSSVADIIDPESLAKVRATKKAMKAKAKAQPGRDRGARPLGAPPLPLHAGPARPGRLPRATASPAGSTSSSSATRSSRPSRCWPGPRWRPRSAATTACPSC